METCLYCVRQCFGAGRYNSGHTRLKEPPSVVLDTSYMGSDVVIVKNGRRICGSGAALANVPIVQDKAYFEVKLQQTGSWGIGLATRRADLNRLPLGDNEDSWVLRCDGKVYSNNQERARLTDVPNEGDVIGLSYDHIEMNFYLNGKNMQCPVTGIRGMLYPVFYVDDGAIMDVVFNEFFHPPPSGFNKIMIEQSLL
ncbi:PREDICTED: SPRY domain-containing protein 7-like [Priapulus caudatus]|uniref:SPRY domain-containing protein 7 n=1 Tax=Priapulus caudatus TaxID=37621 RepID=A0ABM1E167_PRICU|nr:PREDICTED: SPRY domain-containing protein 7-like [Priapulus caudatus]